MNTEQIAHQLVALCSEKKFTEVRMELNATDAVSIEADNKPLNGLQAIEQKHDAWNKSVQEVHSVTLSQPLINGNFFSVAFTWDITYNGRPREQWKELAVFEVQHQKVVLEKFYY